MWENAFGFAAGTSISMVPTEYGPVYVGSARPGSAALSLSERGGRGFGFFAFGILLVLAALICAWSPGGAIVAIEAVVPAAYKFFDIINERQNSQLYELCFRNMESAELAIKGLIDG